MQRLKLWTVQVELQVIPITIIVHNMSPSSTPIYVSLLKLHVSQAAVTNGKIKIIFFVNILWYAQQQRKILAMKAVQDLY